MIKSLVKKALLSGPHRAIQAVRPPQIIALQYHSIQENPEEFRNTIGIAITHSRKLFRKQMEWLAAHFVPISIDDLPSILKGNKPLKRRGVLVTFDDGFRDNLEIAAEILEQFGIRGVFYVTAGVIEGPPLWFCQLRKLMSGRSNDEFRKYSSRMASARPVERERTLQEICDLQGVELPKPDLMMSWEQVRALHRRGHVVGSHTVTHPNLAHVTPEEADSEIRESRARLEHELEAEVRHFSYPHPILFPCFNDATTEMCRRAGYATAVTTSAGTIKSDSNPFALKRVGPSHNFDEFRWKMEYALMQG
jgi:peptidoglycan/xylan/chitin deacetylase (PgdA/CDA1 family)